LEKCGGRWRTRCKIPGVIDPFFVEAEAIRLVWPVDQVLDVLSNAASRNRQTDRQTKRERGKERMEGTELVILATTLSLSSNRRSGFTI